MADIPSRGTGLGSSSSFTVGLLNALNAFSGRHVTREYLAQESCNIEINICQDPIGKQDQYAAAFGGFNLIEFAPDESVQVTPVVIPKEVFGDLQSRLLVFYTGKTRNASDILSSQSADVTESQEKRALLRRMVELAHASKRELELGNPSMRLARFSMRIGCLKSPSMSESPRPRSTRGTKPGGRPELSAAKSWERAPAGFCYSTRRRRFTTTSPTNFRTSVASP